MMAGQHRDKMSAPVFMVLGIHPHVKGTTTRKLLDGA
nr:MAG TPA: hypothetical protein [Caudoviricetes sp.]